MKASILIVCPTGPWETAPHLISVDAVWFGWHEYALRSIVEQIERMTNPSSEELVKLADYAREELSLMRKSRTAVVKMERAFNG